MPSDYWLGSEGYESNKHRVGERRLSIYLVALEANLRLRLSLISFWAPQGESNSRGVGHGNSAI